jgi:hypothetical protein
MLVIDKSSKSIAKRTPEAGIIREQCLFLLLNISLKFTTLQNVTLSCCFWFMRVMDRCPEQRESKLTVLCQLIIIILMSYIIIYFIIIKLLIMDNHPT